jgi:hypothetical protein
MQTKRFDSLLSALSASITDAQRALSRQHQGQLRRLYSDENGRTLTWTFYVPTDEDDRHYNPVELPLISLRSSQELSLTEVSVTFSASVEPVSTRALRATQQSSRPTQDTPDAKTAQSDEHSLALRLKKAGQSLGSRLAEIKILLHLERSLGRVLVNRRELKRFEFDDQ